MNRCLVKTLHAISGKMEQRHQTHPKENKRKFRFSFNDFKKKKEEKKTPCSKSVQRKYILGSTSKGTIRLYTLPSIYYLYM